MNTNGHLTFRFGLDAYIPRSFPVTSLVIVAPFWHDVLTARFGSIYYRLSTGGPEFSKLQEIITSAFGIVTRFEIRELVVATYHRVAYYGGGIEEV